MEVEDPITAKFQTLIESLMAKTTSEIVKVFAEVLLEMRVEVSRSWSGIDELKVELSEEQSAEDVFRSEATVNFKREMEEVMVSDEIVHMPKEAAIESTCLTQGSVLVHEQENSQTTLPDTPEDNLSVKSPDITQEAQVSQTVVKRKRGRSARSSRVSESADEVVSKSPLQAISMVSPQQPSCSSSTLISTSPNSEALALNTDFLTAEDIQDEETAVDEKGIPGFHHVERLAEYLVELRNFTAMALTNHQASTIIDLWQNLDTWDKQRIFSIAQHQVTSHFQSTEKEASFTPGLESTTKCDLGANTASAQGPDCCRLLEAIFVRLCDIHCIPQKKYEGTLTQWTLILQDYRKIRGLVMGNDAVMQSTSLQLVDVNRNSLIQWHNHCIKNQGLTVLLKEDHPPSLPEAEDPLVQTRHLLIEPTQHQALAHDYMPLENIAGHCRLNGGDISEPPAIRPKLSTQRELFGPAPEPAQYLQVVPHISVRAAPVLQALHVLQPVPTFVCAPPQNTIQQSTQDPPQPRQKRAYNRVVQGNTCKKCGQFRSAVTGHSQYKGIVYCPQSETLDKKQWLEKMRRKCK
ncbi:hypothetical protein NFI96_031125 [Prochilodus magdalenae]|nr:hypothetical protein NFI96_031125 [Prochilodus magdalenae]